MVTKPSTEQTQDFSIHNEDFPALPGPNYKDTTLTNNNEESKAVSVSHCSVLSVRVSAEVRPSEKVITMGFLCAQNLTSTSKSTSSSDGPKFPGDKTSAQNNNQKKGIQVLPDGETSQPIIPLGRHPHWMIRQGWGSRALYLRASLPNRAQCMLSPTVCG